ncbi:MAG TPA: ABC transporter permease subunit [Phycisphaerae bacterium]|jgi:ABC-type transport system involved in multi-copper enzyme maturation permease subunit|nr:ABC transporter permease subunit [Phycisphaerae bacterium]HOB73819.1 ABC transporter permease subunit [Phycisphaerae bacterium]HOJ53966.1 ABC transporter permease subunit [Phycisphaerae bacterium]HOL27529.1 ABC transporter permease subunit [Phycisphaerae bacterium]HPP22625.1 ABC transporter permease subunit [Phycisphaerae bacterium]
MNSIARDIGLALWRLLPANPIVLRVVHVGSKRIQHLWARVGYLLILLGVMMAMYLFSNQGGTLADMAKSATNVFAYIAILQLAMICLLAPVFTAGAISQEKDAETFNVLLTTPLTNAQIVLGSLMSRLFFVLALLLAGLPIFCITMLYGGVTTRQVFLSLGIAAATALTTGALAILISVVRVGTRNTIFSFYLGNAFFLITGLALGSWPQTFVPESANPATPGEGMSWLALIHPFLALDVALHWTAAPDQASVAHYAWPLNRMLPAPHVAYMTIMFAVSTLMVILATFFVRRGVKQGEVGVFARLFSRWSLKSREGERRRRARRVWSNPVAWREAVTRANAASSSLVRYGYIGVGVVAALLYVIALKTGQFPTRGEALDWLVGIVMLEFGTVVLMAANTAATAITREREAGTMELLLTTPLTSKYIIWGKLRGLVSFALPLMAVPSLTVLVVAFLEWLSPQFPATAGTLQQPVVSLASAILLIPLLAVYAAFTCLLGLHISLKSRRSVQAVLASVGILVVIGFGLSLCALASAGSAPQLGAMMIPLTFVTAIWYVLTPDALTRTGGLGSVVTVQDIQVLMVFGTVVALGLYGAIVAGTYRSMVTNFDMIVRKQSM